MSVHEFTCVIVIDGCKECIGNCCQRDQSSITISRMVKMFALSWTSLKNPTILTHRFNHIHLSVSIPCDTLLESFVVSWVFISSISAGQKTCILVWYMSIWGWIPFMTSRYPPGVEKQTSSLRDPCQTYCITATAKVSNTWLLCYHIMLCEHKISRQHYLPKGWLNWTWKGYLCVHV